MVSKVRRKHGEFLLDFYAFMLLSFDFESFASQVSLKILILLIFD